MEKLNESFWNDRWINGQTGWDIGYASPAIVSYFETVDNKHASILIPGCGNAYEAKALLDLGFNDITILDISQVAIDNLNEAFHFSDKVKVVHGDFFKYDGSFDFVIEQTFFCAISTSLREDYVQKMSELLKPNGILMGLLFNRQFPTELPPYGGDKETYRKLFSSKFKLDIFEDCYNSIPPRAGNEIFIEFTNKIS